MGSILSLFARARQYCNLMVSQGSNQVSSEELQMRQIDDGAHVSDANNHLVAVDSRSEENGASNVDIERPRMNPRMMNELVNTPEGETGENSSRVIMEGDMTNIIDRMETGVGDPEAQHNNAMTTESQNSQDKIQRETKLKSAAQVFLISFTAIFSMLSANLKGSNGQIHVFIACKISLLGALVCSIIMAVLVHLEAYCPYLKSAFEFIQCVSEGLLVLSGFLAFTLLQFEVFQKATD